MLQRWPRAASSEAASEGDQARRIVADRLLYQRRMQCGVRAQRLGKPLASSPSFSSPPPRPPHTAAAVRTPSIAGRPAAGGLDAALIRPADDAEEAASPHPRPAVGNEPVREPT